MDQWLQALKKDEPFKDMDCWEAFHLCLLFVRVSCY